MAVIRVDLVALPEDAEILQERLAMWGEKGFGGHVTHERQGMTEGQDCTYLLTMMINAVMISAKTLDIQSVV